MIKKKKKASGVESPIMTRKSVVSSFLNQVFSRGKKYYLITTCHHPKLIIIKEFTILLIFSPSLDPPNSGGFYLKAKSR